MNIVKKTFLYIVGAVSIAYEEARKSMKEQQKKLAQNGRKTKIA
jgi:hypothetical protein